MKWKESDHPRDREGKFTSTGFGSIIPGNGEAVYKGFDFGSELPKEGGYLSKLSIDELKKLASNGKSAGEKYTSTGKHAVHHISTLDFSDKESVISCLSNAEKELYKSSCEIACIVTTDGKVWLSVGEKLGVNPDIAEKRGSYSYHSHPADVTYYSFSHQDVGDFLSSGEQFSMASDDKYIYTMERTSETISAEYDTMESEFKRIYRTHVVPMASEREIDFDEDEYHIILNVLSSKYKFKYERKSKYGSEIK